MDWMKLFGGGTGVAGIVKQVGDSVGQFVEKPEDRLKLQQAMAEADLAVRKLQFEAETEYLKDRQSAREMYGKDNSLQKVYALSFLGGYMIITIALLVVVVGWVGWAKVEVPEWASLLVGSIFGAMSTKVSTITDFFFGSSQGSQNKDAAVTEAMKKIPS